MSLGPYTHQYPRHLPARWLQWPLRRLRLRSRWDRYHRCRRDHPRRIATYRSALICQWPKSDPGQKLKSNGAHPESAWPREADIATYIAQVSFGQKGNASGMTVVSG